MDFAENYSCHYQDEVQGAYWTQYQVTLHPTGAYDHCPNDDKVVTETFLFISNYLKHDVHMVQHFQLQCVSNILQPGIEVTKIVHFSDGCAGQHKGKTNFVDHSFGQEDIGIQVEKHYFGSRHSKGLCDAEIGVVKHLFSLAAKRHHSVIATAKDLYNYRAAHLTKPTLPRLHSHKHWSSYFVSKNTIKHDRPEHTDSVKSLQGTRCLHCVQGQFPYTVTCRQRSCFCQACLDQVGDCMNDDFSGQQEKSSCSQR